MFNNKTDMFEYQNVGDMTIIDKYFVPNLHGWAFLRNDKISFEFKARVFKKLRDEGTCIKDSDTRHKYWSMKILFAKMNEL